MSKVYEVEDVEDPPFSLGRVRILPPPQTFAEGQRLVYGRLAAGAGIFCGLCAIAMIALLMWGGWSAAEEHSIVVIFGWALGGFIAAMVAVIVGLLAGARSGGSRLARRATAPTSKPTGSRDEPPADRHRLARARPTPRLRHALVPAIPRHLCVPPPPRTTPHRHLERVDKWQHDERTIA